MSVEIVYKALAILKSFKKTQDANPDAAEVMLNVIWKEIEANIKRGTFGKDFDAYPASLAISHYFYYRGDFQKGIDRLEKQLRLNGLWSDDKIKEIESTVDFISKHYQQKAEQGE